MIAKTLFDGGARGHATIMGGIPGPGHSGATSEDRMLKIDRVSIGKRATVASAVVLLYGAEIGDEASVAAHSVVMKREKLMAGRAYVGYPTRET